MLFGEVLNLFHNTQIVHQDFPRRHPISELAWPVQLFWSAWSELPWPRAIPRSDRLSGPRERDLPLRTTFRGFFPYLQQPLWNPLSQRFRAYLGRSSDRSRPYLAAPSFSFVQYQFEWSLFWVIESIRIQESTEGLLGLMHNRTIRSDTSMDLVGVSPFSLSRLRKRSWDKAVNK